MSAQAGFCGRQWGVLLCADFDDCDSLKAWRVRRSLCPQSPAPPFAATPLLFFLYPNNQGCDRYHAMMNMKLAGVYLTD